MIEIDFVTVFHNEETRLQVLNLMERVGEVCPPASFTFVGVDNTEENRGFAKACNLGVTFGSAPIVGFLNPDLEIQGPFMGEVVAAINGGLTITGCRFGKPTRELKIWGLRDWVCGAAFFVKRDWFESVGGFDERFVWSWEETDLIRQAQTQGLAVRSITLPMSHESPVQNTEEDSLYKRDWFDSGSKLYYKKWGRHGR